MRKTFPAGRLVSVLLLATLVSTAFSQTRRVQNRPYIDERWIHYGFSVGFQMQDMEIVNNGYIDPATGERWYGEVDNYNPGFTVGVLADVHMTKYLALRVQPTMHFGQKHFVFHEQNSGRDTTQNIKSTYIGAEMCLKFSAQRFNNYRPYLIGGVMPVLDLTTKKQGMVTPKSFDCYAELGMGCDIYLPFFKLNPELKFCFGLRDILDHDRSYLTDQTLTKYSNSIDRIHSKMIVLTFYFE
jgi:hypothetical protein